MSSGAAGDDSETLKSLYPFLYGRRSDAQPMNDALLAAVEDKVARHQDVIGAFFAKNSQGVIDAAGAIAEIYRRGGRLYTMGNGGSSCDAAHLAVEFQHPVTAGRQALTAIDLSADRTMLSAVANDVGFDHVFVRQIIALGRAGDGLVGLSTSGNSRNLAKAFITAKEMGLTTIGMAGMSGGMMATIGLDHCLTVECDSIHRIQECHVAIYHILWDLVHSLLANDRAAPLDERGEGAA